MSFIKQFVGSFNPKFYPKLVLTSWKDTVKYLLILIFCTSFIFSVYWTTVFYKKSFHFLDTKKETISKYVNEYLVPISIEDGLVTAEAEQPYIKEIKIPGEKNSYIFIVDTTGQITSLDKYNAYGLLLTKDTLIMQESKDDGLSRETKIYSLQKVKSFSIRPSQKKDEYIVVSFAKDKFLSINKDFLKNLVVKISLMGWPMLLILGFLFSVSHRILQILFVSLFVLLLNVIFGRKLKYENIFSLTAFAITLPLLLTLLSNMAFLKIKLFGLMFTLIYAIYLIMGFFSIKKENSIETMEQK